LAARAGGTAEDVEWMTESEDLSLEREAWPEGDQEG